MQRILQSMPDAIHLDAWLAWNRDGNQSFAQPKPLSFLKRHDVDAIHDHVLVYRTGRQVELVQDASRHQ